MAVAIPKCRKCGLRMMAVRSPATKSWVFFSQKCDDPDGTKIVIDSKDDGSA
jgi:hypothetical protein